MKTSLITFLFLSFNILLFSQDEKKETQFLVGDAVSFTGFGGPILEFSNLDNKFTINAGGGGGAIIDKKFFFGGYGLGTSTKFSAQQSLIESTTNFAFAPPYSIEFGHGGLWFGYLLKPENILHFNVSSKFGWGSYSIEDDLGIYIENGEMIVFTPQLEAEVNIAPWFKLNVGGGYRITSQPTSKLVNATTFSQPMLSVGFFFGWFADE